MVWHYFDKSCPAALGVLAFSTFQPPVPVVNNPLVVDSGNEDVPFVALLLFLFLYLCRQGERDLIRLVVLAQ